MKHLDDDLFDDCLTGDRIDRLGRKFCIIENPKMKRSGIDFPICGNSVISIVALEGAMECIVDMDTHHIDAGGMLLIFPSQIVENLSFSNDFRGYCFIMASSFIENMPMVHMVPLIVNIKKRGLYPMTSRHLDVIEKYAKMVQEVLRTDSNNYKSEIIMHLTIAYYYGLGTYIHNTENVDRTVTRYGEISESFLELVRKNCHIRRDMGFYSDALCLSAKHINLAVKKVTGDNAMKWIERYTVLKAKSLLRTTGLSISEIADSLNFPTPSDFGKYFKKFTGYSPRAFRNV